MKDSRQIDIGRVGNIHHDLNYLGIHRYCYSEGKMGNTVVDTSNPDPVLRGNY